MGKKDESSDLPKRENKEQRRADQEKAARAERVNRDSFSVPDKFADRRAPGTGSYGHERD